MMLATAAAVAALAAPFGELPFRTVGGAASCLRPTGAPGELARWTPGGVEFLTATPGGLVLSGRAALGESTVCPEVAASASGAGVVAGVGDSGLWLALRDPGGTWSAPLRLRVSALDAAVAVSARGDTVLAWQEYGPSDQRTRVRAVRRRAGGLFGAPESLTGWEPGFSLGQISAVAGDDGEFLVAFTRTNAESEGEADLRFAAGRPDVPFGAAQTLGRTTGSADPRLALAADGRALLAVTGIAVDIVEVYERAPGGAFGAPQSIPMRRPEDALAVALRPGGAAAIAWRGGAVVRDGPVPFGTPVALPDADRPVFLLLSRGGAPPDHEWPARMVLGADGRALVAWGAAARGVDAATVSSAGTVERVKFGGPLRDAAGVTPLLLADGTRAVAWSDHAIGPSGGPLGGRVHVALQGAAGVPSAAPPGLVAGQPADRTLRDGQPLLLPVRCSTACDVRATLRGELDVEAVASRASAGTVRLRFATYGWSLAPRRPGPVKIVLRWGAPGAREVARRTITVRLRRSRA